MRGEVLMRRTTGLAFLCLLPLGCLNLTAHPADSEKPTPVALELPPQKAAEVCLATARELEKVGSEAEAILQYEKARQQDPKLTQVSRRLAVLYDRQCDYTHALAEYEQALKQTPKDADLLNDLGYCHYERGDWAEAEKYLRQAVALKPDHKRAWVNLGLALGSQERYPESYEAFAKAVTPAEAHANVGVIQAQQGKTAEARASLQQALTLTPELKSARAVLARVENSRPMERDARARLLAPAEEKKAAPLQAALPVENKGE